jgi:hypothetical protein
MADPVLKLKRTDVVGRTPTTSDLPPGTVGYNIADKKIFARHDDPLGGVVQLAASPIHTHQIAEIEGLQAALEEAGGGAQADWAEIANKPETFPPETHSHPISEVEGLQAALDSAGSWAVRSDSYSEPTYTAGVLTALTTWSDSTKAVLVQTKTFTYTSGNLSQVTTTDGAGATTLTKTINYSGDTLASITEDYA